MIKLVTLQAIIEGNVLFDKLALNQELEKTAVRMRAIAISTLSGMLVSEETSLHCKFLKILKQPQDFTMLNA